MDWSNIIQQIFYVCIIPLLGILTTYIVQYLKAKGNQIAESADNAQTSKYIKMLTDTICNCVQATNQTYVEALKKAGSFDKAAQEEAFQKTYDAVMTILSDDAKVYLTNIYGDLDIYLKTMIEAQVKQNKG